MCAEESSTSVWHFVYNKSLLHCTRYIQVRPDSVSTNVRPLVKKAFNTTTLPDLPLCSASKTAAESSPEPAPPIQH